MTDADDTLRSRRGDEVRTALLTRETLNWSIVPLLAILGIALGLALVAVACDTVVWP